MIIKTNNWSIINKQVSKLDYNPSHDDALESSEDFQSLDFLCYEVEIENSAGNYETSDEDNIIQFNEATGHLELYNKAWKKNQELEGHKEIVTSYNDESITWKVVKEVTDDEFKVAREQDEELYKSKDLFKVWHTKKERNAIIKHDSGSCGLVQLKVMLL